MTTQEYHAEIVATCNGIADRFGAPINKISYADTGIYISLDLVRDGKHVVDLYFAQGDDASAMRNELNALAKKANVSDCEALLYILYSAGALPF